MQKNGFTALTRETEFSPTIAIRVIGFIGTRPDTRLPKLRAGGQGPYLTSLDHLGRSSEVKKIKS